MASTVVAGCALSAVFVLGLLTLAHVDLLSALIAAQAQPPSCGEPTSIDPGRPSSTPILIPTLPADTPERPPPDTSRRVLLNALAPATTDPSVLWDRAHRLAQLGFPLVKVQTTLTREALDAASSEELRVRLMPTAWPAGGIQLLRVPPESLLGRFGLVEGDVLTAVNGRSPAAATEAMRSFQEVRTHGTAVLEVMRNGTWLVIRLQVKP